MKANSLRLSFIASVLIAGLGLSISSPAHAEKMDVETHSLLISKLERVVENGGASDASSSEIRMRLADLLAERARLYIVKAEGKESPESKRDRKRALTHYQAAVNQTDPERRAHVLMQMAHLHETMGETSKSLALYNRVVSEGTSVYPRASVGQALLGWGDVLFRKGEFAKASEKFEEALKIRETERRGYIMYRLAWCNLNLGHHEIATRRLIEILRTPELLTRKIGGETEVDTSFHEDVARDLVSFIARGDVTTSKINLLLDLTPTALRRENLRNLAAETERLGKKKESIFVWSMVLDDEPSSLERVDGRVRLATLEWGLNRKAGAVEQLEKASDSWKKQGCEPKDECKSVQARMRKLITDWNRLEKDRVSQELNQAYAIYNTTFDGEYDMHFWAAQAARLLKKYNDSSELYRRSSILAHKELKKKDDATIRKMFEAALIAQIEMAESGGNLDVKEAAYNHYLDLNPKGERATEVRYQRARVYYDKNRHDKAAEEFRAIALAGNGAYDTRKKAADLALDALVLAKQEGRIEGWAMEFAHSFPKTRVEYLNIARRAVLKEVAVISNDQKSGDSELKRAAQRLSKLSLEGTTKEERTLITKNHMVLAVRTRDLDETNRAADRLLGVKGLSAADRELALEKKVWAAEMRLEFDKAYRFSLKMEMPKVAEADRHLRLAYLAELAGRNPTRHYNDVLSSSRSKAKSELAATRLVRLSKRPWNELKRLEHILRGSRELFAGLVLENFARTADTRKAEAYLQQSSVRKTGAGQTIARTIALRDINKFDKKIASHRLLSASDSLMQQTLKKRLALLKDAEQEAQQAIRSGDWALQVITLTIAARENERLHSEILKLPVPRRLNPEQKKQYAQALASQAAPFQAKADEIQRKLNEFWSNTAALEGSAAGIEKSTSEVARLLAEEVRQLSLRAPPAQRDRLQRAIAKGLKRPSSSDVASARRALSRDPFSERQAQNLKEIEAERGGDAMVAYLDARLEQLKGGVK